MNNNVKRWENLTMDGSTLQCQVSWYLSGWCDLYGMVLLWHIYGEGVTKWSPQQSKQLWCDRDHLVGKLRGGWLSANIAMLAKIDPWQPFLKTHPFWWDTASLTWSWVFFFKIVLFRVPYKHLAFAKVDPTACPIVHGWMDEWMDTSGRCKATNLWPSGRLSAGRCCVCIWYRVVSCAALWRRFYFSQQQFAHLQITHLHICQLSAEEFWQVVCTAVMVVALCWELHHQPQKRFESHNHHHLTHIHHNHHNHHHQPFKFSLSCTKRVKITRTISSWDNENLITRPMLHSNQLDFGRDAAGRGAIASKSGILSLNKFQQQRQFVNLGSISRVDIWSIFGQQQQRPVHQYLSPSVDRSHSYLWSRFAVMCRLRLSAAARSTERAWDATNKNHNLHMRSDQLQFKARSKRCCRMSSVATREPRRRWQARTDRDAVDLKMSSIMYRFYLQLPTVSKHRNSQEQSHCAESILGPGHCPVDRFALNNEHSVETSCY